MKFSRLFTLAIVFIFSFASPVYAAKVNTDQDKLMEVMSEFVKLTSAYTKAIRASGPDGMAEAKLLWPMLRPRLISYTHSISKLKMPDNDYYALQRNQHEAVTLFISMWDDLLQNQGKNSKAIVAKSAQNAAEMESLYKRKLAQAKN